MIQFGPEICRDLGQALGREWLETNGLGGLASSTIVGLNTRRYHGLLTAATKPPVGRMLLLSKLEETLVMDGRRYELSANQYPGAVHPQGFRHLAGFRLDPFPTFTYHVAGVELDKSVFMVHGENTTVVRYELRRAGQAALAGGASAARSCRLELRPLVAFRDFHTTTHENDALRREFQSEPGLVMLRPYKGLPILFLAHDAGDVAAVGDWYRNFEYAVERERGLDFQEDLFCPLMLSCDLTGGGAANVIASTEWRDARHVDELRRAEVRRRERVTAMAPSSDERIGMLTAAADQYVVARGEQKTVIAGYPWFGDWGRDTMIALPGLTLVTGRADVARSVLLAFVRHVDQGMLPNRFPDAGAAPEYNTVDAALWFFEAVRALLHYTGDENFVRGKLYGVLNEIVDWHVRGTRYGIRMDREGLLASGEKGVQLSWMDAKVDGWVVTPRHGKPVEIQALWFNALRIMEDLARRFADTERAARFAGMARRAKRSFNETFWNEAAGCLYDVVDGGRRDASMRPNQIFAVSLPHTMLARDKARRVVAAVERELLTPYGLRSLAPGDPRYRGAYLGDRWARDAAYHQGTVWAWLMGPFITAYVKVSGRTAKSRRRAAEWLAAFDGHLRDAGLGHVSEIFDGDPPHAPRGCIAQAWSVAELLRAAAEDVLGMGPEMRPASPGRLRSHFAPLAAAAGAARPQRASRPPGGGSR